MRGAMAMVPWITTMALMLLLSGLEVVQGQSRVFTTCTAFADGLQTSVSLGAGTRIREICEELFAEGSEESVAVTASSVGRVPFSVIGGDEERAITSTETVDTRESNDRPAGPWFTIAAVDVRVRATRVYEELSTNAGVFRIGLQGLGTSMLQETEARATIRLNNGDIVVFDEMERDEDLRFVVYRIVKISDTVFPGFDFRGSRIYFQVLSQGFFGRTTNIEIGWGPPPSFNIGGNIAEGVRVIETFIIQVLANLEDEFGRLCEFGRNVRTVEGDCNNLNEVEQGSAGQALRRLGGTDPAYPNGNVAIPAGPLDINVREISNALFAMSMRLPTTMDTTIALCLGPGASILEEQADKLRSTCVSTTTKDGTEYVVCPFRVIRVRPKRGRSSVILFDSVQFNDCEDLIFRFTSRQCNIDILLKCSGESRLELADDPCEAETNRLFDPVGCVIRPAEDGVLTNSDGLTDLFFTFAQFVDHDYGLSPLSQISADQPGFSALSRATVEDDFPIEVPENDFHITRPEMEFTRAQFSEDMPDSQVNLHSSYLDASQIYGVDFKRARLLRSFVGGRLDLSSGDLPPFNSVNGTGALGTVVENGPNAGPEFFVVGDARGNEQILLLAMHIVFLREHNLVADEVAKAFPAFDDELIYQTARAIVTAEYQCIVYNEFLPLLLGATSPKAKDFEYDDDLDATVSAIFTTAAYRFGHSLVGTNLLRMGPGSRKKARMDLIPLREAFFKPEAVSDFGIDPFVRGGAWHLCKELDNKIVDELRNFLVIDFPENETTSLPFDLVSLNLQRGRDMGLPSFNDVRELFGLRRYNVFSEFVSDPNLADLAEQIYKDVDDVDLFFGGMVEDHIANSQLGETFNTIIAEQFRRSRDGDRFFYTGINFDKSLIRKIPRVQRIIDGEITFADIILRNTKIKANELGKRPSVFKV